MRPYTSGTGIRDRRDIMKLHGIRIPHKKNTAGCKPVRGELPHNVTIPMSMHIGKIARTVVKKGDHVLAGQLIGEADGFFSSDIHASVSGTVLKIEDRTGFNGSRIPCVTIESDGKMEMYDHLAPPKVNDFDSFVMAVKKSGAVGLGGAGFPSFVKLSVKELSKIEAVVINAAECEPYITSDTRTMIDKAEYVFRGIEAVRKYMGAGRFIIGIENNKREAIEIMKEHASKTEDVEVRVLPAYYPQGGEKVLIYNTTGKIVPRGKLPIDVGVIVTNITTIAFIAEYLETGIPLIEKCITVDGSAVKEPKNVIVPVGTSINDLIEAAGGLKCEAAKILYGGPMMGIAVPSGDEPVLKTTNAVIVMDKKEAEPPKTTACISCGSCINHCPFRLNPKEISKAVKLADAEELERLCVDICMECGCCSYVCPARRPLVQMNKLGKQLLKEYRASKKEREANDKQEAGKNE